MKFLLITIVVLLINTGLFAQGRLSEEQRREFEAQKVAYFTQALELTPQEATVFWPLYNEMEKKIREQEEGKRKEIKACRETKGATDKQNRELLGKLLNYEQKTLNIKKEYYTKLAEKVPPQKICKLDWVEHKFNRQLLDKMRQMSQPPQPRPKK